MKVCNRTCLITGMMVKSIDDVARLSNDRIHPSRWNIILLSARVRCALVAIGTGHVRRTRNSPLPQSRVYRRR
jgi:hypothetical protein